MTRKKSNHKKCQPQKAHKSIEKNVCHHPDHTNPDVERIPKTDVGSRHHHICESNRGKEDREISIWRNEHLSNKPKNIVDTTNSTLSRDDKRKTTLSSTNTSKICKASLYYHDHHTKVHIHTQICCTSRRKTIDKNKNLTPQGGSIHEKK